MEHPTLDCFHDEAQTVVFSKEGLGGRGKIASKLKTKPSLLAKIWRKELDEIYHHTVGASSANVFGRVKLKGVIYYSKEHERLGKSRNSSVISFLENGKLHPLLFTWWFSYSLEAHLNYNSFFIRIIGQFLATSFIK